MAPLVLLALALAGEAPRVTVDQPDDAPGAWQVHVLYVEPSDRSGPRPLDTDGSLRRSLAAAQVWLATRTGGPVLRFDTFHGVLDVTFVKLPEPFTERAIAEGRELQPEGTIRVRDRLEGALAATFNDPRKLYLVYYEGRAYGVCGGAPHPPDLPGRFTTLYLDGVFFASFLTADAPARATRLPVAEARFPAVPFDAHLGGEAVRVTRVTRAELVLAGPLARAHPAGDMIQADKHPPDCRGNAFSSGNGELGYREMSAIHETLHALGIVRGDAHTHGDPNELMYQGQAPWGCARHAESPAASRCVLDPGHRAYFQLGGAATADLARSVFLDPTPAAAVPPDKW